MTRYIDKLTLKSRLLLFVAVPLSVAALLASQLASNALTQRDAFHIQAVLTEISIAGLEVVHELQKERGMSVGYLTSSGDKFRQQLVDQRLLTNERIKELTQLSANAEFAIENERFFSNLENVDQALSGISNIRSSVDRLTTSTESVLEYYSAINATLIAETQVLATMSLSPALTQQTLAVSYLSSEIEQAGLERAMLSKVFNEGAFTPASYRKVVELIHTAHVFRGLFEQTAMPSLLARLIDIQDGPAFKDTAALRNAALQAGADLSVDSEVWFATITRKIEALHALEILATEALANETIAGASAAQQLMVLISIAGVIGVLLTLTIAAFTIRNLHQQIGAEPIELQGFASRIARGDLEFRDNIEGSDTGIMSSMREMHAQLLARQTEDAASRKVISRLKHSLDKMSTCVLVADTSLDIVYINEAAKRYFSDYASEIRSALPSFDANKIMGQSLLRFIPGDEKQFQNLSPSKSELVLEKRFGDRITLLTCNLVHDDRGAAVGATLELEDLTDERSVVEQVSATIAAAANGDLTGRVDTARQGEGVLLELSNRINMLLSVTDDALGQLQLALEALANGDLTQTPTANYKGAFASLLGDTAKTTNTLREIVSQIQFSTLSVDSAFAAITAGAKDLSIRTERSASAIETTASQMKDLASTVSNNAERASRASALVSAAKADAELGGVVVDQAVDAMRNISGSSAKITEITGVIDEIAFQTNLLALNAAVEAARAGEQGRGFAVVANEVRNLASRSATAAQEIKAIIDRSADEVALGTDLVNRSGEKLHEIMSGVSGITGIVSDMANDSREQAESLLSINAAIDDLDQSTQQNAALVEETSNASESTTRQVASLKQLIQFFKLDDASERRAGDRPWAPSGSQQNAKKSA